MGANSKIEWCHHTFNPWVGCTPVSRACDFCYAEAWAKRTGHPELWQGQRRRTTAANWREPLKWNRAAAAAGERHRVFCASLADVFDNQVPEEWRNDLWELIGRTPNLDWLLLTKRPQNIEKMLPDMDKVIGVKWPDFWSWPWPNVWLGTTAEDQAEADRRIPHLLAVPARVRFLSCEPLLGPLDLRHVAPTDSGYINALSSSCGPNLDWVIAGGESGPGARPMHPAWAAALRDQCQAAGVAFHFKQWGEWAPSASDRGRAVFVAQDGRGTAEAATADMISGHTGTTWYFVTRVGKKAAGRLLGDREWNEVPR